MVKYEEIKDIVLKPVNNDNVIELKKQMVKQSGAKDAKFVCLTLTSLCDNGVLAESKMMSQGFDFDDWE